MSRFKLIYLNIMNNIGIVKNGIDLIFYQNQKIQSCHKPDYLKIIHQNNKCKINKNKRLTKTNETLIKLTHATSKQKK